MKVIQSHNRQFELALQFKYNTKLVDICRKLKDDFGWDNFRYDPDIKVWMFNFNLLESVLRYFKGVSIHIPDWVYNKLDEVKEEEEQEIAELEALKSAELDIDLPLFRYQKIGANFAINLKKVMINDEMGLGKSLQAIAVMHYLGLKDVLIICPNSLKANWQQEIKKWTGKIAYIVDKRFIPGYIHIINYEKLIRWAIKDEKGKLDLPPHIKNKWQLLIVDESHYIKEAKSKRTKLVLKIAEATERVLLLTGTPMLNRPKELITQIHAIDRLKTDFGGVTKFKERYCNAYFGSYGYDDKGAGNLSELKRKLMRFSIRRMKKEVLEDLPDKMVHTTILEMPDPKAYKDVENGCSSSFYEVTQQHQEFYKGFAGKSAEEKAEMIVSRQNTKEYRALTSNVLVLIEKLKQEAARQKLLASKYIFEEYIHNNSKAIIFTTHKKIAYSLHELYKDKSVVITGDVPAPDRMRYINQFQNDNDTLFFIATMKTAGVGFNLTAASEVLFMELGWTPAEHKQCEDRAWRIGQKNNVNCNYLIMKDTIDEDIVEILHNKSEIIEGTIEGKLLSKMILKFMK